MDGIWQRSSGSELSSSSSVFFVSANWVESQDFLLARSMLLLPATRDERRESEREGRGGFAIAKNSLDSWFRVKDRSEDEEE
ncbi:unnamed protein product [Eruca vesicaria subsp. sativa]|uniref:Uncharacterized protein n=1 Tax=Eruca vesicaria subsp. sativa TaxID=29727 RepID=A0ABC8M856_ERUVS|nr:unnamed protein product [Eruca vesicaria subsp. sativa]